MRKLIYWPESGITFDAEQIEAMYAEGTDKVAIQFKSGVTKHLPLKEGEVAQQLIEWICKLLNAPDAEITKLMQDENTKVTY